MVAGCATDQASASGLEPADLDCEDGADPHRAERHSALASQTGSSLTPQELPATTAGPDPVSSGDQAVGVFTPDSELATPPSLPDPAGISARLRDLVVTVGQVEELSRRAREAAASDLELYNGIAASQRQFEDGLADARRIGQEAEDVYKRAFGREAKAVAQPAVAEAREVEQAFAELAGAWRQKAELFLSEHPDVESLLSEQRQLGEEARRREIARGKAERFQQLVNATDGALRQGLLDDARDCLKMLASDFPNEADRLKPLHDRLQHRVRAINDAAARRTLVEASELQGAATSTAQSGYSRPWTFTVCHAKRVRMCSDAGQPPAVSSPRPAISSCSAIRRLKAAASSCIATRACLTGLSSSPLLAWVPPISRAAW
jgi:hypothetical protein